MTVTGDISLGSILIIVTLLGIAIRFGIILGSVRITLKTHAIALERHSERMVAYEDVVRDLVASVNRLLGRSDVLFRGLPQRERDQP